MRYLRIYRQRMLLVVSLAAISGLFVAAANSMNMEFDTAFENYINAFYFSYSVQNTPAILMMLLPFWLLITCLIDLFRKDFSIEAVYCFTRCKRFLQWFLEKSAVLAALSFLGVFIYQIVGILFVSIYHSIPLREMMQAAIPNACVFLLSWLFVFSLGMCFNVLSFFVEPKWLLPVFVIVVFIFAVQMQHAVEIKGQWWLNPICHFYIKLHTVYSTFVSCGQQESMPGFQLWHSVVYFAAFIAASMGIGYRFIKKLDFGLLLEK